MDINKEVEYLIEFFNFYEKKTGKSLKENIEIEFRLGIKFPDKFSSNVTKEIYDTIKKKLDKSVSKGIFIKEEKIIDDYFKSNKRMSIIDSKTITITKDKLYVSDIDLKNSPMNIRVSVSRENPVDEILDIDKTVFKRFKSRSSYYFKNWVYDLTIVHKEKNNLKDISYEFELELKNFIWDDSRDDSEEFKKLINSSFVKINEIVQMISQD